MLHEMSNPNEGTYTDGLQGNLGSPVPWNFDDGDAGNIPRHVVLMVGMDIGRQPHGDFSR